MTIRNLNDMIELITSLDTDTIVLEGDNHAILGYVFDDKNTRIAYSVNHILDKLQRYENMSFLEATAHFDNQILSKYQNDKGKPIFVYSNNTKLNNDV